MFARTIVHAGHRNFLESPSLPTRWPGLCAGWSTRLGP